MSPTEFSEFTFGTDDPKVQYVNADEHAPSVAFQLQRGLGGRTPNMAKVLISANDDLDNKVIEGYLHMNAAQLRKLGQDAMRVADLLDS